MDSYFLIITLDPHTPMRKPAIIYTVILLLQKWSIMPHVNNAAMKKNRSSNGIEVRGVDNCLVRLSHCCNPVPGDDIVGFITRGRGVSVHRCDCVNIQKENLTEDMQKRMIDCAWLDDVESSFNAELSLSCTNRPGILADVIGVIAEEKLNLVAANARPIKDRTALIDITIEVKSKTQIEDTIRKLHRVPGIFDVKRTVQ